MANAALLEVRTLRANLEEEIRDLRKKQKNLEDSKIIQVFSHHRHHFKDFKA